MASQESLVSPLVAVVLESLLLQNTWQEREGLHWSLWLAHWFSSCCTTTTALILGSEGCLPGRPWLPWQFAVIAVLLTVAAGVTVAALQTIFPCVCVFFKIFYFFISRERGREGEKEGEKHQCVVASCVPTTGDLAYNPGICPDRESNQRPFAFTGWHPIQWATPARAPFMS